MRHTVALCCLIAAFAWIASADDTFGTAIDLGTLSSGGQLQATGLSIDPESDVDYFTFELLTESDVTIVTAGDSGGDTVMVLYDGDRQVVAEDDDGGTAAYSKVEEDELASGTYYVEIRVYGKSGAIDDYSVTITASGAQEASSAGSLLTLPGIGTPGEVASSDDKADFLRRVAQAMQRQGWDVKVWPSDERTLTAIEQEHTFVFVLTYMYHSSSLSRLVIHCVFPGDPTIDLARLRAINDLNDGYNATKLSLDDDGDVWCEVQYPVHGSLAPEELDAFLVWYDEAVEAFLIKNHEAIGISM